MSNQFVDESRIFVKAGHGGAGMVSFRREKFVPMGGPDGGNGGRGGDVVFEVNPNIQTLYDFTYRNKYEAEAGGKGGIKNMFGRNAEPMIIKVPRGTEVHDEDTGEMVADLKNVGTFVVAKGGIGGKGNKFFANSRRQAPKFAQPGIPGEEKNLRLTLKLIADVGLVGLPNAGKSSLLAALTRAHPKIADYPFTTLHPNLGVALLPSGREIIVADVPGLIEGAHSGAGLGIQFLKHLERTRALVHLVDVSELAPVDPDAAYAQVTNELKLFGKRLVKLPMIVAPNKIDMVPAEEAKRWQRKFKKTKLPVCPISTVSRAGLDDLLKNLEVLV